MTREELSQMVELLRDTAKLHQPNEEILTDVKAESFIFVMDSVLSALSADKWTPIKTRPLTEEEKQEIEEQGSYYLEFMYDCLLPDDGQEVLITARYGGIEKTTFFNEGYDGSYFEDYEDDGDVKAWMPLPEPYKEGGE